MSSGCFRQRRNRASVSHMPADLTLNTFTPHRWARVVSGDTWAEYTVDAAGLIEAQTVRGPLIVWATKTGEGESLPPLHAPTPSPLEVQAARVNLHGHFLAFVRAAHGKVRHSVRWKTGRRRLRFAVFRFVRSHTPFQVMGWPAVMKLFAAGLKKIARLHKQQRTQLERYRFSKAWLAVGKGAQKRVSQDPRAFFQMTRKYLESIRSSEHTYLIERDSDTWNLSPGELGWKEEDAEDPEDIQVLESDWELERRPRTRSYIVDEYHFSYRQQSGIGDWINVSLMAEDAIGELLQAIRRPAAPPIFLLLLLLRRLEAAAYRAHVAQRVRPPARRARIPRPLYARPRPPTAPLAPPVA